MGWGVLNTRVRDEILVRSVLEDSSLPIHVIACVIEERRSTEPETKLSIRRKTLEKDIQTKLNWVDRKVRLIDPFRDPNPRLPDVVVENLPGSPTRAGPSALARTENFARPGGTSSHRQGPCPLPQESPEA